MLTSIEPTGAPRPLEKQTLTVSNSRPYVGQRDAGGDVGVPQPGAVQVVADAVLAAQPRRRATQVVERLDRAAAEVVGVLHRDGRGRDQVRPASGAMIRGHLVDVQPAASEGQVRMVSPCTRRVRPQLGPGDVRLHVADHLLARLDQQPDAEQVGQRPLAQNSPASCPSRPATRASSALTVGSSP